MFTPNNPNGTSPRPPPTPKAAVLQLAHHPAMAQAHAPTQPVPRRATQAAIQVKNSAPTTLTRTAHRVAAINVSTRMRDTLLSYKLRKTQEPEPRAARSQTEEKATPTMEVVVRAWVHTKAKLQLMDNSRKATTSSSFLRVMPRRKAALAACLASLVESNHLPSRSRGMEVDMADSPNTLNKAAMEDIPNKEAIRLSKAMVDILLKAATVVDTSRGLPRSPVWVAWVVRRWGWEVVSLVVRFWLMLSRVAMVEMGVEMEEVITEGEEMMVVEEEATKMVRE